MAKRYTMDDVLNSNMQEEGSRLHALFKKTVVIRQYETEVFESDVEVVLTKPVTGIERSLIVSILQAQLEYDTYVGMFARQIIPATEFNKRKEGIEKDIELMVSKFRDMTGREPDEYFEAFGDAVTKETEQ